MNPHLLPPLNFTHSPHSSAPVRGSPPVVHRLVRHPVSGRDHLLLTFWVHGRGRDEPESLGWVKSAWARVEGLGREAGSWAGLVQEGPNGAGTELVERKEPVTVVENQQPGLLGRIFGSLTTSLRAADGSGSKSKASTRGLPSPGTYTIGEVQGEYIKVSNLSHPSANVC